MHGHYGGPLEVFPGLARGGGQRKPQSTLQTPSIIYVESKKEFSIVSPRSAVGEIHVDLAPAVMIYLLYCMRGQLEKLSRAFSRLHMIH